MSKNNKTQLLYDEKFISSYNNNWKTISIAPDLTEDFISRHADEVYWDLISEYQSLSEKFITKFKDMVDWYSISKYQELSEDFIEKFSERLDWYTIAEYQNLSYNIIEKFFNELSYVKSCLSEHNRLLFDAVDINNNGWKD